MILISFVMNGDDVDSKDTNGQGGEKHDGGMSHDSEDDYDSNGSKDDGKEDDDTDDQDYDSCDARSH